MTSKPLHQRLFLALCLWLQRPGARPTWVYERNVFLLVELVCVIAPITAAPNQGARVALLLSAPFTVYAAELARAARSGDVRRREREEATGASPTRLACDAELERAGLRRQRLTTLMPILLFGVALFTSPTSPHVLATSAVILATGLARAAMVNGYAAWRRAYRKVVPVLFNVSGRGEP